jgi:glutathione S-transferase
MDRVLYIGNKNISSWSMRAWLALREKGVSFKEQLVELNEPARAAALAALAPISPAGRVPVLRDGDLCVFDSLAIMEYAEEAFPGPALYPSAPGARARARSLVAWMHAGFADLRRGVPFEMTFSGRPLSVPEGARRDAETLLEVWDQELSRSSGPYLLGALSLADLTFAPVLRRLEASGFSLEGRPHVARWAALLMGRASVREWMEEAEALPRFAGEPHT